jgi:hypothetical protein
LAGSWHSGSHSLVHPGPPRPPPNKKGLKNRPFLFGGEDEIARGRGRPLVLRFATDRRGWAAASKNRSAIFVEPKGSNPAHSGLSKNQKGAQGPFLIFASGGEGEIRTHVPELPDHPISSRRRYDHFGTSPVNLKSHGIT